MTIPSESSEVEPRQSNQLQRQAGQSAPVSTGMVQSDSTRQNGATLTSAVNDALVSATHVVTNTVTTGLLAGASLLVGSQVALRAGVWMQPRPMPHRQAALLEHPMRLRYRNPSELLGQIGVFDGTIVADLGCGTGLFTQEMALRVGDSGRVHAVDIQAQMIAHARARVELAGFTNRVRFYHSGLHTLPLPDKSVDVVLMAAVLGELPARVLALDEVRRTLKPGGRLAISEELPDPAYTPMPLARRWAEQAGFRYGGLMGNPFCYTLLMISDG